MKTECKTDALAVVTGNANAAAEADERTAEATAEAELAEAQKRLAAAGIVSHDGADFLAANLPPPKWIVEDFIALGMKGDLCGGSKTYKTYLGLSLALSVAAGRNWLDALKINEPHKAAYLDLELFPWNAQERIRAACSPMSYEEGHAVGGLGIAAEKLRGRFFYYNLRHNPAALREVVDSLVVEFKNLGVEFVVVDPRYKLLKVGEDENSADGLRGILEFRDKLAEHFAVMIVTHDPKGDTAQKKTTDRGAGSYTGGADFDFRVTIDKAADWKYDNLTYVVEFGGRARELPAPIGVKFDKRGQTFHSGDGYTTTKADGRLGTTNNAESRATKEQALQKAYLEAALAVVNKAGDKLLDTTTFDNEVAKIPGASLAVNRRKGARDSLVRQGVLAVAHELERKPDGKVGNVKNGRTFISTPELIAAYQTSISINDSMTPQIINSSPH